ncbi:hypothetical protein J6590_100296 [Homalodisca vitripennis]|nr:hypothetical protein J6590_100296 [Homalodisca vitripennis]
MELSTKLSSLEKHGEPTPKMAIKELTRKAGYRILEAKKVDTKFDRKAVMLLVEVDSTKTAVTFLPVRFEKTLDDSDLQEMTSSKSYYWSRWNVHLHPSPREGEEPLECTSV